MSAHRLHNLRRAWRPNCRGRVWPLEAYGRCRREERRVPPGDYSSSLITVGWKEPVTSPLAVTLPFRMNWDRVALQFRLPKAYAVNCALVPWPDPEYPGR